MSFRILREAARSDLIHAIRHSESVASLDTCLAFSAAAEAATQHLAAHPESGSPRMQQEPPFRNLRVWAISGFPYLMFYINGPDGAEVLRVLHTSRDIPTLLRDAE